MKELQKKLGKQQERQNRKKQELQSEKIAKEAAERELHYIKANLQKGSLLYQVCSSLSTATFDANCSSNLFKLQYNYVVNIADKMTKKYEKCSRLCIVFCHV